MKKYTAPAVNILSGAPAQGALQFLTGMEEVNLPEYSAVLQSRDAIGMTSTDWTRATDQIMMMLIVLMMLMILMIL